VEYSLIVDWPSVLWRVQIVAWKSNPVPKLTIYSPYCCWGHMHLLELYKHYCKFIDKTLLFSNFSIPKIRNISKNTFLQVFVWYLMATALIMFLLFFKRNQINFSLLDETLCQTYLTNIFFHVKNALWIIIFHTIEVFKLHLIH